MIYPYSVSHTYIVKIKLSHFFVFPIGSEIKTCSQLELIRDFLNEFLVIASKT